MNRVNADRKLSLGSFYYRIHLLINFLLTYLVIYNIKDLVFENT